MKYAFVELPETLIRVMSAAAAFDGANPEPPKKSGEPYDINPSRRDVDPCCAAARDDPEDVSVSAVC